MLPTDINITAKAEEHTVGLREVRFVLTLCVEECELSCGAEGHAHCYVLVTSPMWIEGSPNN